MATTLVYWKQTFLASGFEYAFFIQVPPYYIMREVVILRRVESREPAFHQPPGGASWAWIGEHAAHAPILSARFAFRRERRFPIAKARLFHQLCWWFCGLKHTTKNTHCTLSLSQPCSALSLPLAAARQTGCRKGVRFSFSRS